ncbi:hypothetical protein IMSAGC019_00278 [Lachnospiraceae bacterium]|nr:hypothetical protein IMSAGC019_00278 [Lachnospiraceae bacterium]
MRNKQLSELLSQYKEVCIYGAGIVAYGAYKAVRELYHTCIECFLVTSGEGQPDRIAGIPVMELTKAPNGFSNKLIIVATPEEYHNDIVQNLKENKYNRYFLLDSHEEYILMSRYLKKVQNIRLIEDYQTNGKLDKPDETGIYMAVSHKDKPLKGEYEEAPWIKKIQAGAALTEDRIVEITDEGADSLSTRNSLYCELSASYYIWKYSNYRITGLFHYRRILNVTEEQLHLMEAKKIDVILPLPFVCYPDASGQYGRYLMPEDIYVMHEVLQEFEIDKMPEIERILQSPYLYNYNMLIARREVFYDYCSWMFPLLEKIVDRCEKEKREKLPRYAGRIGEVLTSLYFMLNKQQWNIAHAEKIWRI